MSQGSNPQLLPKLSELLIAVKYTAAAAVLRLAAIEESNLLVMGKEEAREYKEAKKVAATLVLSRLLNKQVDGELDISEIIVKVYRGKVMEKMKADSLADLVK